MSPYERGRGVTLLDLARDAEPVRVTPASGKGALGTWRFQDGPRTQSRGNPILEAGTSP